MSSQWSVFYSLELTDSIPKDFIPREGTTPGPHHRRKLYCWAADPANGCHISEWAAPFGVKSEHEKELWGQLQTPKLPLVWMRADMGVRVCVYECQCVCVCTPCVCVSLCLCVLIVKLNACVSRRANCVVEFKGPEMKGHSLFKRFLEKLSVSQLMLQ